MEVNGKSRGRVGGRSGGGVLGGRLERRMMRIFADHEGGGGGMHDVCYMDGTWGYGTDCLQQCGVRD